MSETPKLLPVSEILAKSNKDRKIDLIKDGPVYYMVLNAISIEEQFMTEFEEVIATIEKSEAEPSVLVSISTHKSIYCAGYNLPWFMSNPTNKIYGLMKLAQLLARFIKLGLPTMACLNGSTVAGGVFLAFSHDTLLLNAENPKT